MMITRCLVPVISHPPFRVDIAPCGTSLYYCRISIGKDEFRVKAQRLCTQELIKNELHIVDERRGESRRTETAISHGTGNSEMLEGSRIIAKKT